MTDSTVKQKASWLTAAAATMFIFAIAMDPVMMPIATTAVVEELNTDTGMVQAAIALVSLVAAPLYITGGKLGDIHGKKRIFLIGVILWGIGPLTAALAPSMLILIGGWSVIKALGMVLAIPASVGLLIANYPDETQRGQAFAYYGVGAVAAALVGPLLMGFSAEALSWRVPFGILVVLAAIAFLLSAWGIKETEKMTSARIDWGGTLLTFLAVASVILGSMLGGRFGWWLARRPFTLGEVQINPLGLSPAPWLIAIGVVLTAILLARLSRMQERGEQPLISMELFDNRTFFAAWGAALFAYVLSGALPFIVPVFSQQALGFDSLQSALVMVAFSIGSIILGFASGKLLQRIPARTLMQVFLLVTIAGLIWLVYVVDVNMTLVTFLLPMFVTGAGFGAISAQIPNIQLSNLRPRLQGEGSGFSETGKELGIGLGIAVIGSIMFSMAIGGLVDSVAREVNIPLTPEQRAETILLIEDEAFPEEAVDAISQQLPNIEEIGNEAFVEGFQIALGVLVAVLLVALLVASFIPKVETAQVTGEATRELVADVSSKRL
ncbi:MAG: MFS transporter [Anaerolineales bacterium]